MSKKGVSGQFWVANGEKTMCPQNLRKLHYGFGFYSLNLFFVFLD